MTTEEKIKLAAQYLIDNIGTIKEEHEVTIKDNYVAIEFKDVEFDDDDYDITVDDIDKVSERKIENKAYSLMNIDACLYPKDETDLDFDFEVTTDYEYESTLERRTWITSRGNWYHPEETETSYDGYCWIIIYYYITIK